MASKQFARLHAKFSKSGVGQCVAPSEPYQTRSTATLMMWEALESLGLVRLRAEVDEHFDPSDFDCDMPEDTEAFGSIGEFRLSEDDPWQHADSCWGHTGYQDVLSPFENAYIVDIMSETIEAFQAAWKAEVQRRRDIRAGRCPACHGSGQLVTA